MAYALGQSPKGKDVLVSKLEEAAEREDDEEVLMQINESLNALREGRRAEYASY